MGRLDIARAEQAARETLKNKRLEHTLGVRSLVLKLAGRHGVDSEAVEFAALLHDWAKEAPRQEFLDRVEQGAIEVDAETLETPNLFHAFLSAYWIEEYMDVHEKEILDAVRFHPTGDPSLGKLGKILFVADYSEEGRAARNVAHIRQAAMEDLDIAAREVMKAKLHYLLNKYRRVHSRSWAFWNALNEPGTH